MTNYKPVKILFDLDDEYHLKLYEHLKHRSNGSSYIRALIHQDLYGNGCKVETSPIASQPLDEIVKEPEIIKFELPTNSNVSKTATVKPHSPVKLKVSVTPPPISDEDIFVEDLI